MYYWKPLSPLLLVFAISLEYLSSFLWKILYTFLINNLIHSKIILVFFVFLFLFEILLNISFYFQSRVKPNKALSKALKFMRLFNWKPLSPLFLVVAISLEYLSSFLWRILYTFLIENSIYSKIMLVFFVFLFHF